VTALREIAEGNVKFNEDVVDTVQSYLQEMRLRGARVPHTSLGD